MAAVSRSTMNPTPQLWLPNFCRYPTALSTMAVAELVVLIISLAPGHQTSDPWATLALNTCFVQWIAIVSCAILCLCRPRLHRLKVFWGMLVCFGIILAVTIAATLGALVLDNTLGLRPIRVGSAQNLVLSNVLIASLVAAAALRYFYVQRQWLVNTQAQADAQLKALQARIRPHFLFNSMNIIASLIRTRPMQAEETVEDLSDLFRAALATPAADRDLGEELELVRRYLKIESLRLGDRLSVVWDVDNLSLDVAVPPLLIQPLIENAVYHGIQQLPEGGEIRIEGNTFEDHITLSVGNPKPDGPPRSANEGNQVALENIRQRLDHLFEGRGDLSIEDNAAYYLATLKLPRISRTREDPDR